MAEQSERIRLVGGPGDGLYFMWSGGDVLHYKAVAFSPDAPREIFSDTMGYSRFGEVSPSIYRRSLNSSARFVFQP